MGSSRAWPGEVSYSWLDSCCWRGGRVASRRQVFLIFERRLEVAVHFGGRPILSFHSAGQR